jgi:hypothetical protein
MSRAQFQSRYGNAAYGNAGGYATKLQAAAVAARYNSKPKTQRVTPGSAPDAPSALTGPGGHIPGAGSITNPLGGINAIGDFFNRLTQPNTWIRVGEVVAGLLLVYLGLSATMRGTEAQRQFTKVKSTTKKVAAVAAK